MHDGRGVIRREIAEGTWTNDVVPKLDNGVTVTVWGEAGAIVLRKVDGVLQAKLAAGGKFTTLSDEAQAKMKAKASLTPAHVSKTATHVKNINQGNGFEVTEFANEPLSMVHHTGTTKGEDKNPHLTVENAHVLAAQDLLDPNSKTRDVRSKAALNKTTIKQALFDDYGLPPVDNLNFYPPEATKGAAKKPGNWKAKEEEAEANPYEQLSMERYLQFLAEALSKGGAAPEFGAKIIAFSKTMGDEKKLDPAQLFLRVGMDESELVRAVLIIDGLLPAGSKLAISAPTRKVFEKWWNVTGNDPKVPYLPPPDSKAGDATLRSGNPHGNETWGVIEGRYCREAFAEFVRAINAFTPVPAVIEEVAPKGKGKGGKAKK